MTKQPPGTVTVRFCRFAPPSGKPPRYETLKVPLAEPVSAMVLMRRLHELDPGCTCRTSMCFKGACGACLVRLNGRDVLGCSTIVHPGEEITLEPASGYEVLRDLVVDFSRPRASTGSDA